MSKPLQVLILESEAADARAISDAVSACAEAADLQVVTTGAAYGAALAGGEFELILSTYQLPDFDGEKALAERNRLCPQTPFIIVSGNIGEEKTIELFRDGITDCVFKNQLPRLGPVVQRALREVSQARDRTRMEALARERTNYLQMQQVVAAAANEAASVDDALQAGLDLVCAYAGFPIGHAFLVDQGDGDTIVPTEVWHLQDAERHGEFRHATTLARFRKGQGLAGRVLAQQEPVWVQDLREMPDFRRFEVADRLGLRSGVAFPVMVGKSIVALLEFFSEKIEPPDQRLLEVMVYVGTQLGRVVEREQAEQKLQERTRRQDVVALLAQRALQESNLEAFLDEAVALVAEVLSMELAGVLELVEQQAPLRVRASFGWHGSLAGISAELSLAGYALKQSDPVTSRDLLDDSRFEMDPILRANGARSGIVAVIAARQRQLGVLCAFCRQVRDFQPGEISFLQTIADVLASAMERDRTTAALRLLNSAVEQTTESITVTDAQLDLPGPRILFVNAAFTRMTGWSARDVSGFSPRILQGPKTDRQALANLRRRLQAGENVDGETINYRKDGTEFWIEWHVAPIRDGSGKITQFFAIQRDVTARKQAEEALRESQASLAAAQRITHLGSWELDLLDLEDLNRNPLRWSDEVFRIFGHEPGSVEVTNENFLRAVHPADLAKVQAAMRTALETGAEYAIDHRIILPNGAERHVHEQSHFVREEGTGRLLKMTGIVQDITERLRNEEAQRESEERFRATFEQAAVGISHVDLEGRMRRVNQRLCDLLGCPREELLEKTVQEMTHPDDATVAPLQMQKMLHGETQRWSGEIRFQRPEGPPIWANLTTALLRDESGGPKYFIFVMEDISARKKLEQQFLQAQKMEAFGRLAGGVAHDFNNLLTVISGYNSILLDDLSTADPRREFVEEIGRAADRASALTNQLLAFSRQQVLQPKVFAPNEVLESVEKMLGRIIGEDVELLTELAPELGNVRADVSQIENVLVNMAVNARDAMPRGGTLTIRTVNFTATEKDAERMPDMSPGHYVCISITDTGTGMTENVRGHIFEPFFTTKDVGQGTGLGLATCYGIVSQSGGHIAVESELGRGTTFLIYLPRVADEQDELPRPDDFSELPRGTETILLVEDDAIVRRLTLWVLRSLGYQLLEAAHGEEAFSLMQTHRGQTLDLVITDVVMPQMSGKDLAFWIRASQPGAKILFISGYPNHELDDTQALGGQVSFLPKPFAPRELARKVREMLDS